MALTEKQEAFCQSYLIDFNGSRAARSVGYSDESCRTEAWRLLTNADIQQRIFELRQETGKAFNITRERIAQELALIAFGDTKNIFDESGALKSPQEWTDEGRIISSYEESVTEFGDETTGGTKKSKKVRQWEKTKALEALSRMMGYNEPDKILHSGIVPIQIIMPPDDAPKD